MQKNYKGFTPKQRLANLKRVKEAIKNGELKEILTELGWIYKYSLKYKWSILWYITLGVFGVVMSYGASILSKYIIDAVTGRDSGVLVPLGVFYVVMQVTKIAINAVTSRVSAKINLKVDLEIRSDMRDNVKSQFFCHVNLHSAYGYTK